MWRALLFAVLPASPKDFGVMAWGSSPSDPDLLRSMRG